MHRFLGCERTKEWRWEGEGCKKICVLLPQNDIRGQTLRVRPQGLHAGCLGADPGKAYSSQSIGSTDKIATPMRFQMLVPGSVS